MLEGGCWRKCCLATPRVLTDDGDDLILLFIFTTVIRVVCPTQKTPGRVKFGDAVAGPIDFSHQARGRRTPMAKISFMAKFS